MRSSYCGSCRRRRRCRCGGGGGRRSGSCCGFASGRRSCTLLRSSSDTRLGIAVNRIRIGVRAEVVSGALEIAILIIVAIPAKWSPSGSIHNQEKRP
jgi:hypothetical protein